MFTGVLCDMTVRPACDQDLYDDVGLQALRRFVHAGRGLGKFLFNPLRVHRLTKVYNLSFSLKSNGTGMQ